MSQFTKTTNNSNSLGTTKQNVIAGALAITTGVASTSATTGSVVVSGGLGVSGNINVAGVLIAAQTSDIYTNVVFSVTPSFNMSAGMLYALAPSTNSLTSFSLTNIPTTAQATYVFTFILQPTTASSAFYLKPPNNIISVVCTNNVSYSATVYGVSSLAFPSTYTYLLQQITLINKGTLAAPIFIAFISVVGY